jgi:NADH dehydrogenase
MTVMVTGASGVVGRAAVRALLERDEVRAVVRRPEAAEPLRALGAKVSVRPLDHADALAEILPRCHTLVHLIGGPNQPDHDELLRANHGSVLLAIEAAKQAGTARFAFVSVPGAAAEARDPFLRAKGLAEEAVLNSGLEHAIVRATHVYGLGGLWFTAAVEGALAEPPFAIGAADASVAPVLADDLGAVLAAIDDAPGPLAGIWALEGPDAVTSDELTGYLRADRTPPVHARDVEEAAHLLAHLLGIPVSASAAAYLGRASRADAPDAAAAFGVGRTPLAEGLRRTLEDAATAGGG